MAFEWIWRTWCREFWKWMIHRAKDRNSNVFFCAEAYNDDPAKVLIAIPRSVRTTA